MEAWGARQHACSPKRARPCSSPAAVRNAATRWSTEIAAAGGSAHFVPLDVADQDHWDAAVAQVKDQAGGLHVLINIVGSNDLVMLPEVDIDAWNRIFEINVTATLRGIQTCAPLIKDSGGGSIALVRAR